MAATDRVPRWTIAAPFFALIVYLLVAGGSAPLAGVALAAGLLAAVLAAVHHAEVVAARAATRSAPSSWRSPSPSSSSA